LGTLAENVRVAIPTASPVAWKFQVDAEKKKFEVADSDTIPAGVAVTVSVVNP
jgi:hypothetical protein